MWNQCCAVPLRPQVLTGECQFSNWRLVFPSFPFWAWLFRSNQAIVVLSLCGPGLGSYGQLLPSHQTFSQSFSSTGQPRGPLEPPQIIKPWFYIFFLPSFKDCGLSFWVPGVFCQCSEVILWNLFSVQMIF